MKIPKITFKKYKELLPNNVKVWVAESKEYDIVVQAPTLKILNERIAKTIRGHIAICKATNKVPFECIKRQSEPEIAMDEYSSSAGYGGWGHDE